MTYPNTTQDRPGTTKVAGRNTKEGGGSVPKGQERPGYPKVGTKASRDAGTGGDFNKLGDEVRGYSKLPTKAASGKTTNANEGRYTEGKL
jgi:hypothetical protein